jgi:hypothetical protein
VSDDGPVQDDALMQAVRDVELHESGEGWDRPPAIFALVPTEDLVRDEPELAAELGLSVDAGGLTAVAQEDLELDDGLPTALGRLEWPSAVVGVVLALETVAVPADVEAAAPDEDAGAWAMTQDGREEARVVVGVLRDGRRASALRWRTHDDDTDVLAAPDLAPGLAEALLDSLRPD